MSALLQLLITGLVLVVIWFLVNWVAGMLGVPPVIVTIVAIILIIYFIWRLLLLLGINA